LDLGILTFAGRADPSIKSDFHGFAFRGLPPSLPFAAELLAFFFEVRLPSRRIASEISFFLFTAAVYPSR
jgi:hypothetical protein